jgi:hypothetical protein
MSRYRWLRPLKCIGALSWYFPTKGMSYEARQELLFKAIECGDVRVMFNDVIVPKAHISTYLQQYARATPEQEPNTLPPDLLVNYDDLCAVFDRPNIDNRKRGRPVKEGSGPSEDRKHAADMHGMLSGSEPRAKSAAAAARMLVDEGRVSGAGTPESRAKRLERAFRKYYSS